MGIYFWLFQTVNYFLKNSISSYSLIKKILMLSIPIF